MRSIQIDRKDGAHKWGNWHALVASLILSSAFSAHVLASDSLQQKRVEDAVKVFCDFEFNGAQDVERRKALVHFSPAVLQKISSFAGPVDPYVFFWDTEPLEIVDAYELGKVQVGNEKATALVKYRVVGKREKWASAIRKVDPSKVSVSLQLELIEGRWQVVDPQPLRVSRQFILKSYKELFLKKADWYESAGAGQWRVLKGAIDTILLFEK